MKQIANIDHYSLLKTLPRDLSNHIFTPSQVITKIFHQSLGGGVYKPYKSVKVHSNAHRRLFFVQEEATPCARQPWLATRDNHIVAVDKPRKHATSIGLIVQQSCFAVK